MKPRVSIIFPAYNVAPYLDDALKSIANQSYQNFEIIAVDDGSTDSTPDILENWRSNSNLSDKMTVIHKLNGGLSDARNVGYAESNGEYIFFMDSDDYIHPDLLKSCVDFADNQNLDLIQFEYQRTDYGGRLLKEYSNKLPIKNRSILNQSDFIRTLYDNRGQTSYYHMTVWSYFIRRDIMSKNNLLFYKGIIHEDELFTPQLIYFSQRIGYLNENFYFYRKSKISITQNNDDKSVFNERRSHSLKKIIANLINFKELYSKEMNRDYSRFIDNRIRVLSNLYINLCPSYKSIFRFISETGMFPIVPIAKTTVKRILHLREWRN